MYVVGLTGGIGTGKSEVARVLKDLGATVINADIIGHEAYRPHSEIWQEVVETFGESVLQVNGEIDRKELGNIIFRDPGARAKLNSIMHPWMARTIEDRIRELGQRGVEAVVVEAALLIEAGWRYLVDEVWVTSAPEEEVVRRVRQRSNLAELDIRRRVNSQMPVTEKLKQADVVLENDGELGELRAQVERLWNDRVIGRIK